MAFFVDSGASGAITAPTILEVVDARTAGRRTQDRVMTHGLRAVGHRQTAEPPPER
ncbi:MAG: hypothetical protein AAF281_05970 [Pseudomonadota bacterium]